MISGSPLIFTDLDGTLLDHQSYSWAAAQSALSLIAERGIPLIFNSSKTRSELLELRKQLANHHPFIVENGSALYLPEGYFSADAGGLGGGFERQLFSLSRSRILQQLLELREGYGFRFRGFDDMSVAELAAVTGLSPGQAEKAKQRDCSEPVQWQDSDAALQTFRKRLEERGLRLLRGGRFLHVMGATDKAEGIHWLLRRFRERWPEREFVSIALGDSPNDRGMLEAVDIAVVIEPERGEPLQLNGPGTVLYPGVKGPAGWQLAMSQLLGVESG